MAPGQALFPPCALCDLRRTPAALARLWSAQSSHQRIFAIQSRAVKSEPDGGDVRFAEVLLACLPVWPGPIQLRLVCGSAAQVLLAEAMEAAQALGDGPARVPELAATCHLGHCSQEFWVYAS